MSGKIRIAALLSALVLLCGMLPGAGAFQDDDKITNPEDFAFLSGLGILVGDDQGNANPDAALQRAQVAKMLFVAATGETDASAYAGEQVFADVYPGFWGEGYINYAAEKGIVSGRGMHATGKPVFDPNTPVTLAEYLKIVLVHLGYDAAEEGMQDTPDWAASVMALARETGLTAETGSGNSAISRADAAEILTKVLKLDVKGPFALPDAFAVVTAASV
ncbi:S-layer homology domain-containing protein, partial [Oscillospiraceae bacterium OttesenSCG-928-F05]|nr:S-layer homology domain-containing protein [Oscillospiraceae bacterium OttesenSCG-928-F05]